MNNPTLLTIISFVLILLGAYSLYNASKRAREAKERGETFKWFKQINALVGVEYLLLAWVFMLNTLLQSKTVPSSVKNVALPFYLLFLVGAAVFAGLVFRRGIINTRTLRSQARTNAASPNANGTARVVNAASASESATAQDRAPDMERRRERRKNAASARRRRAGRA
jgi:uncharacterized membrane protein YgdD (TMEM256/DUF423 family)